MKQRKYKRLAYSTKPSLLELIFPYIDNTKDLLSAAQVCKTWHAAASSNLHLWQNINVKLRRYAGAEDHCYDYMEDDCLDDPTTLELYKRDFKQVLNEIEHAIQHFQTAKEELKLKKGKEITTLQTLYYDGKEQLVILHTAYTDIILNKASEFKAITLVNVPISTEKLLEVFNNFATLRR